MSSIVLDLQQEILNPDSDVVNLLRKAHVIAVKLQLKEFDSWIMHELNGYENSKPETIPEYRVVKGTLRAFNPYRGWIPAQCGNDEIEKAISERRMWQSISELQELYNQNKDESNILMKFSAESMLSLMKAFDAEMEFSLHISTHLLKGIIDKVKNCLLEWTLKLESEGILGEDMSFNKDEKFAARNVPQQIYNYGNIINGDVVKSQVLSGNNKTISFDYEKAKELIDKLREAIESETISQDDKETANELMEEVEDKINAHKKPAIIKSALSGLKDFLINAGANVAAALILDRIFTHI